VLASVHAEVQSECGYPSHSRSPTPTRTKRGDAHLDKLHLAHSGEHTTQVLLRHLPS
jgi:hypothetical protein